MAVVFCCTLASVGHHSSAATAKNEFSLIDLAGMEEFVAASKGKMVVVNFFASWCLPCREEIPGLIAIRSFFSSDRLAVLGVSVDEDMVALKNYAKKAQFNYPVRLGLPDLLRAARVSSIPHMSIFDKEGNLLVNEAGFVPEQVLRDFLTEHIGK